ncbi:X-ray radiation resistance-associated protein 1 [Pezoporus flaviventris]|uniref:X-ray radiation resistance-associated protein 1 n=1 Tax=Pezoporus flaviventris TaxID=889875 RepID=UPI002AAF65D2|nr:X-ray radiation resistance-associated protein 1 [Pezoporus flaviventris]
MGTCPVRALWAWPSGLVSHTRKPLSGREQPEQTVPPSPPHAAIAPLRLGIQRNAQALHQVLNHPLGYRDAGAQLDCVQKPCVPRKKHGGMLGPPAWKTKAEILEGILLAMRNTGTFTEVPLATDLQGRKSKAREYREVLRLMEEFQEVFGIPLLVQEVPKPSDEAQMPKALPAQAASNQLQPARRVPKVQWSQCRQGLNKASHTLGLWGKSLLFHRIWSQFSLPEAGKPNVVPGFTPAFHLGKHGYSPNNANTAHGNHICSGLCSAVPGKPEEVQGSNHLNSFQFTAGYRSRIRFGSQVPASTSTYGSCGMLEGMESHHP